MSTAPPAGETRLHVGDRVKVIANADPAFVSRIGKIGTVSKIHDWEVDDLPVIVDFIGDDWDAFDPSELVVIASAQQAIDVQYRDAEQLRTWRQERG